MDEQQTPTAGTPIYQESSNEKSAKWLWLLIILIIIGALAFAYWKKIGPFAQFRLGAGQQSTEPSPSPITFSSPTPEASTGAELNKSEAKIRVLNGTNTSGLAASAKDFLEGKGYKVATIGNAVTRDFTKTIVKFKTSFAKYGEILVGDLSGKYSVSVDKENLEATDSADIEVTVGSK